MTLINQISGDKFTTISLAAMLWYKQFVSKYGKGCDITITRLRYSAITMHWITGQSEHTSLFRKAGQRGATIMYGMWKIMCVLNLKPRKQILLHKIHKKIFLASSWPNSTCPAYVHSLFYMFVSSLIIKPKPCETFKLLEKHKSIKQHCKLAFVGLVNHENVVSNRKVIQSEII